MLLCCCVAADQQCDGGFGRSAFIEKHPLKLQNSHYIIEKTPGYIYQQLSTLPHDEMRVLGQLLRDNTIDDDESSWCQQQPFPRWMEANANNEGKYFIQLKSSLSSRGLRGYFSGYLATFGTRNDIIPSL